MKKSKYLLVAVAVLSLAVPAFARLSKYKDWPNSPEGYFMTKAERDQWSRLDSDTDAEKFIADFVAKRPANFEKEVAERAANADKYLTIGKTQGSKSLRGKIIILFGVPTSMDQSDQVLKDQVHRDSPVMAGAMSNGSGEGGGSGRTGDDVGNVGDALAGHKVIRNLHFNYQGDAAKVVGRKQVDITVQIDPITGKDGINSRSLENEVNGMFDMVAESWIKK